MDIRIFIRCDILTEEIDSYLYKYCRDLDSAFSQTLSVAVSPDWLSAASSTSSIS